MREYKNREKILKGKQKRVISHMYGGALAQPIIVIKPDISPILLALTAVRLALALAFISLSFIEGGVKMLAYVISYLYCCINIYQCGKIKTGQCKQFTWHIIAVTEVLRFTMFHE